jgi:hypothetical protein
MPMLFQSYETQASPVSLHRTCNATINGSALTPYQNDYRVSVICAINDPTLDRSENRLLAISKPFAIQEGRIAISTPYSKEMMDHILLHLTTAETGIPKGTVAEEIFPLWYQVALLPKNGCDGSDVHRLSDVPRCGGMLLPEVRSLNVMVSGVVN